MATVHDIVAVEAEFTALVNNPRRPLSRFIEVSLAYGEMLAEHDPQSAVGALALAIETLHDPPAPAELPVALGLLRTMRAVAAPLGLNHHELDAITREQHIVDAGLVDVAPGEREALWRRAAAVHFDSGSVEEGFGALIEGLRTCGNAGLDELATDMLLAIRRMAIPEPLLADIEALWVFLRRHRSAGDWPFWCLVALGAVRLKFDDVITAQMYLRRAETLLGARKPPVVAALVNGWVALSSSEFERARGSFHYASNVGATDDRIRLLTAAGLGEALLELGRVEQARTPLTEAIAYEVGDPATVARCHELLSTIAAEDARYRDAYEHLLATRRLERLGAERPELLLRGRRETVVDLRDHHDPEFNAEPPLRTVSNQLAEQAIVDEVVAVAQLTTRPEISPPPSPPPYAPPETEHRSPESATDDVDPERAAATDRLEIVLRPIVENASGEIRAAQAILWLVRADGDTCEALALANRPELRRQVTLHTIRRACRVLSSMQTPSVSLLVDVSEYDLDDVLVELVATEVRSSGCDPARLVVVLSGARLARSVHHGAVVDALRAIGVGVGVSGLGSAFTSSDVLLSCPVDVVTLDSDVFERARGASAQRRVIEAASSLARGFGFELIATGVADAQLFDLQVRLGCHGAQGPFVGEAVAAEEFARRVVEVDRSFEEAVIER